VAALEAPEAGVVAPVETGANEVAEGCWVWDIVIAPEYNVGPGIV